ncbi:Hypothetical predicted protein, partial [Olea europaea subsp. europaea]
ELPNTQRDCIPTHIVELVLSQNNQDADDVPVDVLQDVAQPVQNSQDADDVPVDVLLDVAQPVQDSQDADDVPVDVLLDVAQPVQDSQDADNVRAVSGVDQILPEISGVQSVPDINECQLFVDVGEKQDVIVTASDDTSRCYSPQVVRRSQREKKNKTCGCCAAAEADTITEDGGINNLVPGEPQSPYDAISCADSNEWRKAMDIEI